VSRCPKYFLHPHSAGSASSGTGRPVRHYRLRLGVSPQTLQTPPHDERPVLRHRSAPHDSQQPQPPCPPPNGAQRGITPAFGYGPRLGPVRLDFHQQALCAARRTLRTGPPLCPASVLCHSRPSPLAVLPLETSRPTSPIPGHHYRGDRFSCSIPAPATSSRHLYTGHHQGHTQAAPRLRTHPEKHAFVPDHPTRSGFDAIVLCFDASAVVHTCSSSRHTPAPLPAGLLPQRSPPRLLTDAACGGLGSPPARRTRRALLHHWYSTLHAGDLLHRHHSTSGHTWGSRSRPSPVPATIEDPAARDDRQPCRSVSSI